MMDDRSDMRPSNKIFISNLNMDTTQSDLRKGFQDFGMIVDVTVKHKDTGITYGFVEFDTQTSAERAVQAMNKQIFMNKELKVQIARGKSDKSGFRKRQNNGPPKPFGTNNRVCYNCQEQGHIARDCTNPRKERPRGFENRDRDRNRSRDKDRDRYRNDYKRRDNYRDRDQRDKKDYRRKRSRSNDKYRSKSRSRSRSYEKRRKYRNRSASKSSHS